MLGGRGRGCLHNLSISDVFRGTRACHGVPYNRRRWVHLGDWLGRGWRSRFPNDLVLIILVRVNVHKFDCRFTSCGFICHRLLGSFEDTFWCWC